MELIDDLPDEVVGVRAIAEVEGEDYESVLEPAIEDRLSRHDTIRLLVVLGPEYEGYGLSGAIADLKLGVTTFRSYDKIALVSDSTWMGRAVETFGRLMPGKVRALPLDALDEAREWVTT